LAKVKEDLKTMTQKKQDLDNLNKDLRDQLKNWENRYYECEKSCELKIKNKELEMEALK